MLLCHNYENVSIHILPEELASFSFTFYVQILADVHVCIYVMFLYIFIVFIELLLCFMILCQKWRNKTVQSIKCNMAKNAIHLTIGRQRKYVAADDQIVIRLNEEETVWFMIAWRMVILMGFDKLR